MDREMTGTRSETRVSSKTYAHLLWRWIRNWYWLFSLLLILFSLCLGFWGLSIYYARIKEPVTVFDLLYKTLKTINLNMDLTSHVPWPLEVSRFLTPILFANALILGLSNMFKERFAFLRLWSWRNHVIICGLGNKGVRLAKQFRKQGYNVVVIEKEPHNEHALQFRFRDTVILSGDATDEILLRRAGLAKARYLLALCGNDGVNAEIAAQARALMPKRRKTALICFIHILDLELCRLLREREIESESNAPFHMEFFNAYEMGARILLQRHPLPVSSDGVVPHIVIAGPGRLGSSLIVLAAREWRDTEGSKKQPMTVTVVDRNGPARIDLLCAKYPYLDTACTFDIRTIDTYSREFAQSQFLFDSQGKCVVSAVYICVDGDSAGLMAAFTLYAQLERKGCRIPIIVRMSDKSGFASLFSESDSNAPYGCIRAFRLMDETCLPSALLMSTNESIAQAIHADYLQKELAKGETPEKNPSAVPWERLPEKLRESNRHQAFNLAERLHAFGYRIAPLLDWDAENYRFTADEIEGMSIMEHDRWSEEKRAAGFTYASGEKTKRTHPDLLPWSQLDEPTREKDRNMVRAAPRFLARVGFQVERITKPGKG